MKPDYVDKSSPLIGAANTVFKQLGYNQFKAVKSRYGDVVLGAIYSESFVKLYAKESINVYISGGY